VNNKLIKYDNEKKWVNPFYEPSIGAQIAEAEEERTTIRQSAEIKQTASNGKNQVKFAQIGQIINVACASSSYSAMVVENYLKQNLPSFPEHKKMLLAWIQSLPQPRLKNAVKELIELFLGVFLGNYTAAAKFLGTSRRVARYRFPKFTRS
jgi:ABC-type anion transport system duplicated permease subunit